MLLNVICSGFPHIDRRDNEISFGRAKDSTVLFEDKRVSAKHCRIIRCPDERKGTGHHANMDVYLVEDLRLQLQVIWLISSALMVHSSTNVR